MKKILNHLIFLNLIVACGSKESAAPVNSAEPTNEKNSSTTPKENIIDIQKNLESEMFNITKVFYLMVWSLKFEYLEKNSNSPIQSEGFNTTLKLYSDNTCDFKVTSSKIKSSKGPESSEGLGFPYPVKNNYMLLSECKFIVETNRLRIFSYPDSICTVDLKIEGQRVSLDRIDCSKDNQDLNDINFDFYDFENKLIESRVKVKIIKINSSLIKKVEK